MLNKLKGCSNTEWYEIKGDFSSLQNKLNSYYTPLKTIRECWPRFQNELISGIELIIHHITNKNKIVVLGDYDVDGVCGTVIISKFLAFYDANYEIIIPNRINDGYGLSMKFIDSLQNVSLLITIDNGSNAIKEVQSARNKGIDVLILDHHSVTELPNASFIMNGKIMNHSEIYDLCATGIVFVFLIEVQKYMKKLNMKIYTDLLLMFDLVALATVCDVVPLSNLNRALVKKGINLISNKTSNWSKLITSDVKYVNMNTLGFRIGPYINAAGRFGNPQAAYDFLYGYEDLNNLGKLVEYNTKRKQYENEIMEEILSKMLMQNVQEPVFIYFAENWPEGLIGIIAARVKDIINKPTIIFTRVSNTHYKASARSFSYFNIGNCILAAKDLIVNGGGHCMAGGLTLDISNQQKFISFVYDYYQKNNTSTGAIIKHFHSFATIDNIRNIFEIVSALEPVYETPIFCFLNVQITFKTYINNKHAIFEARNIYTNYKTSFMIFDISRSKLFKLLHQKVLNVHLIASVDFYNDVCLNVIDVIILQDLHALYLNK